MPILPIIVYGVLAVSYLGLALGYLPGLRMNRATIALVGSALLVGLGVLTLEEAWQAIDPTTIVFLLSMMVVNAYLSYSGFFQLALAALMRLSRSPLGVLTMLTLGTGLLSAFFLNDTIAIIFTPLTIQLTQTLGLNPIPYLLAIAGATNLGSVATLSGNPQNILIGSFSGISYPEFSRALAPVAVIGLVVQLGLLWLLYPEVRSTVPTASCPLVRLRLLKPLFTKTVVVTAALLIAFVVGVPVATAAFIAAAVLLITRRIKPQRVLQAVDWSLLVLFSGLFILTRCTQQLDLLGLFADWIDTPPALIGFTAVLSNLISNVPAVLLIQPLIPVEDQQAWLLLAASSTLAGNLTLFGAVANLITAEAAANLGYKLSFWEHLRFGLPLTLMTLIATYVCVVR